MELTISEGSLEEVRLQLDLDNRRDLSSVEEGRGGERREQRSAEEGAGLLMTEREM